MLKKEKLNFKYYRVYSDINKKILHKRSGEIHSEYVVDHEPYLDDYKEVNIDDSKTI